MKKTITDKAVKALRPKPKPYEVRDDKLQGFLLRVQPSGVMTYYLEYKNSAGKRNRHRLGSHPTMTVPQAQKKAREKANEVFEGGDPQAEKKRAGRDLTLRQFLDDVYAPWAKVNLKSHGPTLIRLKAGFAPLLDKRLVDLCVFDFEKHRISRLKEKRFHPMPKGEKDPKPRKPPTQAGINRDQMTMRAALSRAVEWKHIDHNPLDGVKKAKEDKNRAIRAMTEEEEIRVMGVFSARHTRCVLKIKQQAMESACNPPIIHRFLDYLQPMIVLSLDCGLRRGEVLGLLWSDVNLLAGTVTVRGEGAKSSQTREIPLGGRVLAALTDWSNQIPETGKVFPGASVDSIRAKWRVLLKDADVKGLRWHDLRHTFGTRLALNGVALPTIQRLMGHASITTTQRYLHSTADDARRAIQAMEGSIVPMPQISAK